MTPRQRVVDGERTVEGYVSGIGRLVVERVDGAIENYDFGVEPSERPFVDVLKGDIMQWQAAETAEITFWEVCFPPYKPGRFEDLT